MKHSTIEFWAMIFVCCPPISILIIAFSDLPIGAKKRLYLFNAIPIIFGIVMAILQQHLTCLKPFYMR